MSLRWIVRRIIARSILIGLLLVGGIQKDIAIYTTAKPTVNIRATRQLQLTSNHDGLVLEMKASERDDIWISTADMISTFHVEDGNGTATPNLFLSVSQKLTKEPKFHGIAQYGEQFLLVVNARVGCVYNISITSRLVAGVVVGVCDEKKHVDGNIDAARLFEPTRIVENPVASHSYLILDQNRIKNIDFQNKRVATIQNVTNADISNIATNSRGVVFAVVKSRDEPDYMMSFSLLEPQVEYSTLRSSPVIRSDFVFVPPLFGASISSLTFVNDDMLLFIDASNRALKLVHTKNSNTGGVLTICQPLDKPTIQFIDADVQDECSDSFDPSIVRAQNDRVLVLSENKLIVFDINESDDDENKALDAEMLAVYICFSSVVGVLVMIVLCLVIRYRQLKMRYGHEKRRQDIDISFPLPGIYIEPPVSVAPRPAATLPPPAASQSTSHTSSREQALVNAGYSAADDSDVYEEIVPSKKTSVVSDDDSFYSTAEQTTPV